MGTTTKTAAAIAGGRSRYTGPRVIKQPGEAPMLKSGQTNSKLGRVVEKGSLMGAEMFSLSLEERRTCPRTCSHWGDCYGNNMPFAHRFDHTHPSFTRVLEEEVAAACDKFRLVLVRLHVLGDFFDVPYVFLWDEMLRKHPNLHCFGYTAWHPHTAVGNAIDTVSEAHGWERFAIRHSGLDSDVRSALAENEHLDTPAFWCPEQTGQAASCAACAACWNGMNTVRFKDH